jgi:HAE1 family hydrophobic/amphiphilic exporter-1
MLAATVLALFAVPVLYVAITRLAYGKKGLAALEQQGQAASTENTTVAPA